MVVGTPSFEKTVIKQLTQKETVKTKASLIEKEVVLIKNNTSMTSYTFWNNPG